MCILGGIIYRLNFSFRPESKNVRSFGLSKVKQRFAGLWLLVNVAYTSVRRVLVLTLNCKVLNGWQQLDCKINFSYLSGRVYTKAYLYNSLTMCEIPIPIPMKIPVGISVPIAAHQCRL